VGLTVELVPDLPSRAAELSAAKPFVFLAPHDPSMLWYATESFPGFKLPEASPLRFEFPQLRRGLPLRLFAQVCGWSAGEPVLLEDGREVGRGKIILPATGQPRLTARVPMRYAPASSPSELTVGPADVLFRDDLTSAPLGGVAVSMGGMGEPGRVNFQISRPDGSMRLTLRGGARTFWLDKDYIPVSLSLGRLVNKFSESGIELTTGTRTAPGQPIEVRLFPVRDGKVARLSFVDGMGHPVRGVVTVQDGPRLWLMGEDRSMGRDGSSVRLPKWREGVARLSVSVNGERMERLGLQYGHEEEGIRFPREGSGTPCIELDFDRINPSRPYTIQLNDYMEMPKEGTR
jgi:hypothetical protein